MANIVFNKVEKVYLGGVNAVNNFNLEINNDEFIIFVGPSGCGKTTVLRMLAGLEEITSGNIYIDGRIINDVDPKDRDIAMVFQNYALYPHMSVYENMAFGLKLRKIPKTEIKAKVLETAKTLGIEELLDRKPKALSGGQKQRVALGRAIVRHPKVFLMDEPLSNLDAKLRVQTRTEIVKLHKKLKTTFIYVTHDQTEAMTMADKIVVMRDGVIEQFASPTELYNNPVNMFVAGFIGSPQMNFLDISILEENGKAYIYVGTKKLILDKENYTNLKEKKCMDRPLILGLRPEALKVTNKSENFKIEGIVDNIENMGNEKFIFVKYANSIIIVREQTEIEVNVEETINLIFDLSKAHFFYKDTKQHI
ncbi:MAG: ABC transporter ATP-binding protein [Bacilli bacterium]